MLISSINRCLCISFLILLPLPALSEVYQWTDKHGRTHFGDRPPQEVDSKDISKKLDRINITSDYNSPDMMLRHEKSKDAERQKLIDDWKERRKNHVSMPDRCKAARQHLTAIKGRVVFVDDNGKEVKVSEEMRKQRVKRLEQWVQKYC